jgi:hypothetical protein
VLPAAVICVAAFCDVYCCFLLPAVVLHVAISCWIVSLPAAVICVAACCCQLLYYALLPAAKLCYYLLWCGLLLALEHCFVTSCRTMCCYQLLNFVANSWCGVLLPTVVLCVVISCCMVLLPATAIRLATSCTYALLPAVLCCVLLATAVVWCCPLLPYLAPPNDLSGEVSWRPFLPPPVRVKSSPARRIEVRFRVGC